MTQMPPKDLLRFYAAEISYFSAKVRPALRLKRVPHVELLPTPEVYRDVILPRTGLAFIPVIVTPEDETLQDSSDILDWLDARHPEPRLRPTTPVQEITALLLELYADEFLVLPAMHYRWSFPESEAKARGDFAAMAGDAGSAARFAGRMSGSIRALGVLPETHAAIEAHLGDLLDALSAHFAAMPFLLGGQASLADCALMGPLRAHLYLDAVPGRLLRERAPRVCHWIERSDHPAPTERSTWLPDDALAPTLRPVLELVGRDALPLVLDTVRDFERWADADGEPGATPPRALGFHETTLRGVRFQRYTSAYTPWMLQRVLDPLRRLGPDGRAAVSRVLDGTGCEAVLDLAPRHRVEKRGFKLVLAG